METFRPERPGRASSATHNPLKIFTLQAPPCCRTPPTRSAVGPNISNRSRATLGIIPELASSYLLPRIIGFQRAKEICFFGEEIPAEKLYEMGLVNRVLPHGELLPFAREQALRLIAPGGAELAVRWTKRAMHRPLVEAVTRALDEENEALNLAVATADFMEGVTARKERRSPLFRGK
ncbi:MAG: hypothetical protein JRF59_14335 [Deltaproteobacteria bacterium]|nr:hypothetical protein [Deltaproteobacteria bacterium]MBW1924052.1 hypothetical protein [Deltaproteobacteria bacterium]MBW1950359.1 hypothetical protein [Deltaproteobacteria bacterium]MBW2348994.1 hypothetical protein [Deltaproteobacteria bacterium]RLB32040.1 MAG: hypothetical protein DRH20_15205 [Deltaproteobacteria bacterium]